MNLKQLSDAELLTYTEQVAASERKIYSQILEALREIEDRKLYLKDHSSLFSFCTKRLRYSGGAAQRRIESMRLLRTLKTEDQKEIKNRLDDGSINLTHLSQVAQLVRAQPKAFTPEARAEVIREIENTSQRECEKKLVEHGAPPASQREHLRTVSSELSRLSINLDEEALGYLQKLLELTAHQNPYASKEKAVKLALKMALEQIQRKKAGSGLKPPSITSATEVNRPPNRYIPNRLKQAVWRRDRGQCVYVDPKTNTQCSSSFGLEFDHIQEFSKGGAHRVENLRLYCRLHNRHRSVVEKNVRYCRPDSFSPVE